MRRLVWFVTLCALLWSGWWFIAASSLRGNIENWFADRQSEGWQAEAAQMSVTGFPLHLNAELLRPVLADPQTGVSVEGSSLSMSAPAWWPGYVTLMLPGDEILFATPQGKRGLTMDDALATLRLHPGADLQLEEIDIKSGQWQITSPQGTMWGGTSLTAQISQNASQASTYDLKLDVPEFRPGSVPRRAFNIPADWPLSFDSLQLQMRVRFDRPIDRTTIEIDRPQPQRIDLTVAEAIWGSMLIRGTADLDVSLQGVLTGELSLQARNWKDMLTLAETAGTLPQTLRPQIENILGALARGSGNEDALDLTLQIKNGKIFLGFIPLGDAPRLILP